MLGPPDVARPKTHDNSEVSERSRGSPQGTVRSLRGQGSQAELRATSMLEICAAYVLKSRGHDVTWHPWLQGFTATINTGLCQHIHLYYFYPS